MLNINVLFITKPLLATTCIKTIKKISFLFQKLFLIAALVVNLSSVSHSQKFIISEIPSQQFTIDRINQEIYLKDFLSDTVRKIDLGMMSSTTTNYLFDPPVFANKLLLSVFNSDVFYYPQNKLYLHNNVTNLDFQIIDSAGITPVASHLDIVFSPNDKNILFPDYYFSLTDSSLYKWNLSVNVKYNSDDLKPRWSSDTSFVFISNDSTILEYYIESGRIDTLVDLSNYYSNITGFAYNTKQNILAYSIRALPPPPQLYFHYKDTKKDSLVFSPFRDDSAATCWHSNMVFTSFCWSPDFSRLAFFLTHSTDFGAGIYIYSIDSSKIFKATDCYDPHFKYMLNWINKDTLIYSDPYVSLIYGLNTSFLTSAIEKKDEKMNISLTINNYPNPFNNTTSMLIQLPHGQDGDVFIFDVLGRLLKKYHLINTGESNYKISWDGKDEQNNEVTSGFYLGILKCKNSLLDYSKVIKMILLK